MMVFDWYFNFSFDSKWFNSDRLLIFILRHVVCG